MDLFRKHRRRHLSEGDQSREGDDEPAWLADSHEKRASEPFTDYTSASLSESLSRSSTRVQAEQSTSSSTHAEVNPLGLTLVYACPNAIQADLIFVHGLGGSSRCTWSWEEDPVNFWLPWLCDDSDLSRSRIFTFGYNADISGPHTSLNILDFAKDLLFRMKTYSSDNYQNDTRIGKVPIVFVAYSMGGLVVKKAFIIGKSSQQYADIIENVSSIVFLATPHKGSAYAQTVNNLLKISPVGGAKKYMAELERNSNSLQDINEQFRNVCGGLELISFYETLKTAVAPGVKKMILEKDAALLEYPGEISSSLIADHYGVVKFKNPADTNYTNVKNLLKWLMRKCAREDATDLASPIWGTRNIDNTRLGPPTTPSAKISIEKRLIDILGIHENVDEDLEYYTDRTMEGSCQWLLQRETFQGWAAENPSTSGYLWLTGNPGSGKSITASFIINLLKKRLFAGTCHYYFFRTGHQNKRTLSYLLRNIALQAALSHEAFCSRLLELYEDSGIDLSQQKAVVIWEKIFEGIMFRLPAQDPIFWVLDGLDEAESPTELIKFLSKIRSATRINVMLISRATKDLLKSVNTYLPKVVHEFFTAEDSIEDIRGYVRSSIEKILPGNHSQEEIVQDILAKASGSFLWVRLALDRVRDNWYTREDIREALTEIPKGMEPLYEGMIELIASQPHKPRVMATRILTWVACSFRPLEIAELEVALEPEFKNFVNLGHTVEEICGHFVVINKFKKVTLIHETASRFLLHKTSDLRIKIKECQCHEHLALVCINFLSDTPKWRRVFSTVQAYQQLNSSSVFRDYPFLSYALSNWAYHVSLASVDTNDLLDSVLMFLEENCLLWINGVALSGNNRILTQAAQHLKTYIKRKAVFNAKRPPKSFALARDGELRQWANDVIRLVGRFGHNIAESPSSVHKHIVPFCPKDSIISRSFSYKGQSAFSVSGISSQSWDDCLARLNMGEDQTASKVFCKDAFFVTLIGITGTLIVWYSETCEEARRLVHGEYVSYVSGSSTSNRVATAGFKTTRVWDITTGEELYCLTKERHHHTRALAFGADDNELIIAYDDCTIHCFDLGAAKEKWSFLAKEPGSQDFNCARHMSFSPDLTQIAIVFRGRPVVMWNINRTSSTYIAPKQCVLTEDTMRSAVEGDAWNAPELALWQPGTDHLLVLYEDTKIVHWNVADDEQTQHDHTAARGMTMSADGSLLLTSDVNGTLSIWVLPEYRLTYQLKYEELVTDLAFSPDGTRFYDIRGTFCNVWEPDALILPNDLDLENTSSPSTNVASEPVISNDDNTRVMITALACDTFDKFYCCGKEDGSVTIYAIPNGEKLRKVISHSSSVSVIRLAWSVSGKYLASADDSGRIIVKRLKPPTSGNNKWAVFPLFDIRADEAVEQILLSTLDDCLLVAGRTVSFVMNMKSKQEICRVLHPNQKEGVWINHPMEPTGLIRIDSSQERQHLWETLAPSPDESISLAIRSVTFIESSRVVQRTVLIRDIWLVLEVSTSDNRTWASRSRQIELLDLSKLPQAGSVENLVRRRVEGLAQHVRRLIGSFQDRVVFMDHHFWLCTWDVELVYKKHKRHFFLPKDWLNPTALRLILLNKSGTLLCPRNGEVAVVRSGLKN